MSNFAQVLKLFPVPMYKMNLKDELSRSDLKDLLAHSDFVRNDSNDTSKEKYILDGCPSVKSVIQNKVDDFFYNVLEEDPEKLKLRITQSWINRSKPGEHHHAHSHINSVISGVFYLQCNLDTGSLYIHNPKIDLVAGLATQKKSFNNDVNYHYVWFKPEPFDLYIFPSFLTHNVSKNMSDEVRISLAFNTFYSGTLGLNCQSTELIV